MPRKLICVLLCFAFAGCSTNFVPYRGDTGGFKEQRLGTDLWQVSYSVPISRKWSVAEDLCLLRSAQIAESQRAFGFEVERIDNYETDTAESSNSSLHLSWEAKQPEKAMRQVVCRIRLFSSDEMPEEGVNRYRTDDALEELAQRYRLP